MRKKYGDYPNAQFIRVKRIFVARLAAPAKNPPA